MSKRINKKHYIDDWRENNKFLKRLNLSKITLEEYIDERHGKGKYKPRVLDTFTVTKRYVRETEYIPSLSMTIKGDCSKRDNSEKLKVSSKYIIGQAYNKGGFQVLTDFESKDPQTGKRR